MENTSEMEITRKNLNMFSFDNIPPGPTLKESHIDKNLDFVEVSSTNDLLVGSSNLNGWYWSGSIWYFLEPDKMPQGDEVYSRLKGESGVCDGKFLSDDKVIVGEDLGTISIMQLHRDNIKLGDSTFTVLTTRSEHDHAILSVSVAEDKTKAVTGSMDKCIKVWDVSENNLLSEHTYRPAHKDHVTCVAMNKTHPHGNLFGSCSLDGAALVWDTRLPKPGQVIYEDVAIGFTSLAWLNDVQLVVGTTMGDLTCIDTRNRELLNTTSLSTPRPVHRIVINNSLLAACSDDKYVRVIDTSNDWRLIYSDTRHRDYARGLAWVTEQKLVSCGWDGEVYSHTIPITK